MSFLESPVLSGRTLLILCSALASAVVAAGTCQAADAKRLPVGAVLVPGPSTLAAPTGAELVGKLLAERTAASDPDVPLPQRDLVAGEPSFIPLTGARVYGRRDEGSLVLGLKIPIPADRGAFQAATRSGGSAATNATSLGVQ